MLKQRMLPRLPPKENQLRPSPLFAANDPEHAPWVKLAEFLARHYGGLCHPQIHLLDPEDYR
jgi:hypothetical protein